MTSIYEQRDDSKIKRQRHGREAKGGVSDPQLHGVASGAHLISGAVVKL
jgi:hypothetical protein